MASTPPKSSSPTQSNGNNGNVQVQMAQPDPDSSVEMVETAVDVDESSEDLIQNPVTEVVQVNAIEKQNDEFIWHVSDRKEALNVVFVRKVLNLSIIHRLSELIVQTKYINSSESFNNANKEESYNSSVEAIDTAFKHFRTAASSMGLLMSAWDIPNDGKFPTPDAVVKYEEEVRAAFRMPTSEAPKCCICFDKVHPVFQCFFKCSRCPEVLHYGCAATWFKNSKSCPHCRLEMSDEMIENGQSVVGLSCFGDTRNLAAEEPT